MLKGGSTTGSLELKSNYIYSETGIPHKVQLVASGKSLAEGEVFYHIYIDGVEREEGLASSSVINSNFAVMLRENMTMASASSYKLKECDWYVTNTSSGLMSPVFMTEEELKKEVINVPNLYAKTQSTTYRTDDYVTGVNADLAASLKAVLETTEAGDKYVEIPSTRYNRPETLFNGTADGSVKLVSRTTGAEIDPAAVTGTMDNYYLKVKGIYVIPKSVEAEAGTLDLLGVSYNAKEKVAKLAYSEYDAPDAKFMVMMGDLVNTGTNASQWTNYFATINGYSQSIPHMAVVGNHELSGTEVTAGKYFSLLFLGF